MMLALRWIGLALVLGCSTSCNDESRAVDAGNNSTGGEDARIDGSNRATGKTFDNPSPLADAGHATAGPCVRRPCWCDKVAMIGIQVVCADEVRACTCNPASASDAVQFACGVGGVSCNVTPAEYVDGCEFRSDLGKSTRRGA